VEAGVTFALRSMPVATTLLDLFVLVVISLPLVFRAFIEVFVGNGYLVPIINEDFDESLLQYTKYPESWRRPAPSVHVDNTVESSANWLTPNLYCIETGTSVISEAVVVFLIIFLRNDVKVNPYACGDLPSLSAAKKAVKAAGTLVVAPFMGVETSLKKFLKSVIVFILFIDMRQQLLGVEDVVVEEVIVEAEEAIFAIPEIKYPYLTSAQYNCIEDDIRTSYGEFPKGSNSRIRKDGKRRPKHHGMRRRLRP
jgi:hypothetical protein